MKYLFIFFNIFSTSLIFAQFSAIKDAPPMTDKTTFPKSWTGQYRGTLDIHTATGLQQSVDMQLEIVPLEDTDRWIWAITYGADSVAGRRSYELITVDSTMGHYQIDEKNSIVLDAFLRGNIFTSRFLVMGNLLDCIYEKTGDKIIFTIIMGNKTTVETGGGVVEGDTIPLVQAYPVGVVQRGRLRRVN